MNEEIRRILFHECGHAIIQHIFGWSIEFVAIGRMNGIGHEWNGSATADPPAGISQQTKRVQNATVRFAGPISECLAESAVVTDEQILLGRVPLSMEHHDLGGWVHDAAEAKRGGATESELKVALTNARQLLSEKPVFDAVKLMADALGNSNHRNEQKLSEIDTVVRDAVFDGFEGPTHSDKTAQLMLVVGKDIESILKPLNLTRFAN